MMSQFFPFYNKVFFLYYVKLLLLFFATYPEGFGF